MAEKNGIQISAGFDLKSRSYVDIRQSFETLNELIATPESQVPNGFISFCEEDKKYYQFLSENEETATGKWRVWMGSAAEAAENNGKIKIDETSQLQYLGEALDGVTLVVEADESGVKHIKAKTLDGLLTTVEELNYLQGLDANIVDILEAIGNPMNFKGVLDDDNALELKKDTADDGDMYIITASESMGAGGPVVVVYDGNEFKKIANVDFKVRDFKEEPLDLSTEVTGTLAAENIDEAIARKDDVLDKATYAATNEDGGYKDGVVKAAESIEGFEIEEIENLHEAIEAALDYKNNEAVQGITKEGDGTKYLADDGEYKLIDPSAVVTSDVEPENKKALWNHIQGEEGNYTYTLKYFNGTEWTPIVSSEGSLDVITREDPTTVTLGDIKPGTVLTGLSAIDVLIKAAFAYRAPEISLSITPDAGIKRVGTEVSSITLSANTKKISKAITEVEFLKGTNSLEKKTEGVSAGGTFTHNYGETIKLNTPGSVSFSAKVSDGDNTVTSNVKTYEFINPMYWGYTGNSPSEKLQKKGEISLTKLNPVDNSVFVMYPTSYGDIKSIKDPNNFEVIDTFTKTTQSVTVVEGEAPVSYNVYTSPRATNTDFSYKFTF